jgi:hypothetical protein
MIFAQPKVAQEVRPQLSSKSQEMPPTRAVRVPDAMQRFFSDASQSRDPSQVASRAPDQQRTACALHSPRDRAGPVAAVGRGLTERIALMTSEIERLQVAMTKKWASRDAANNFFKS